MLKKKQNQFVSDTTQSLSAYKKNWPAYFLLSAAIVFYCLDFFFRISPSLVVKELILQYHISATGIGVFATAFYLGYVIMQIPSGYLLDRLNLYWVLFCTILLCAFCYSLFILGHVFFFGIENRFLLGIGSAVSFIAVLYVAKVYFSEKYFTLIAGITIALGTIVSSGMQFICATFITNNNWHKILFDFASAAAILVITLFLIGFFFKSRANTNAQKNEGSRPRHIFSEKIINKRIILNSIIGGLFYLPTSIFAGLWGISFLQSNYHITITTGSFAIMLIFLGWAISSPLLGYLASQINRDKKLILIGSMTSMLCSIVLLYSKSLAVNSILVLSFLFGFFSGFQVIIWNIFSKIKINEKHNGITIALTNAIIMIIPAIIHILVGEILQHSNAHLLYGSITNFHVAFMIIPLAFFSTSLLIIFI